jgi:hypothetical protein
MRAATTRGVFQRLRSFTRLSSSIPILTDAEVNANLKSMMPEVRARSYLVCKATVF